MQFLLQLQQSNQRYFIYVPYLLFHISFNYLLFICFSFLYTLKSLLNSSRHLQRVMKCLRHLRRKWTRYIPYCHLIKQYHHPSSSINIINHNQQSSSTITINIINNHQSPSVTMINHYNDQNHQSSSSIIICSYHQPSP